MTGVFASGDASLGMNFPYLRECASGKNLVLLETVNFGLSVALG